MSLNLRRLLLLIIPPALALAAVIAASTSLFSGNDEPPTVAVYEGDSPVARASKSAALDMVEERVGFRPVVPRIVPVEGDLMRATAYVPPGTRVESPRSHLTLGSPGAGFEDIVMVAQGTEYWGVPLDDARPLDVGVETAGAWALREENTPGADYWLNVGDMWLYLMVGPPLSDFESTAILRDLTDQLD